MCQQTILGFSVSLRQTSSNGSTSTVISNYYKGAVIQIVEDFWPISRVVCLMVHWNRAFWTFISPYFLQPVFPEKHQLWGSRFFIKSLKINIYFKNAKKKFRKSFLFLRQLHLNSSREIFSVKQIMLVTGSECVNKQS